MSDTIVGILMLPVLALLVLVLECGRMGCVWVVRRCREAKTRAGERPVRAMTSGMEG